MALSVGQEKYAFLGGVITEEMLKTRKGSLKVRILGISGDIIRVEILKTGMTARIHRRGIVNTSK